MKIGRLLIAVGAATLASAVFTVPDAAAKPGYFTFPAERISQFTVKGTRGFDITVARIPGRVQLSVSADRRFAAYVVRSRKTPWERIDAKFPGLGRVAVRFYPKGEPERLPPFCKGRPEVKQHGIFRGTIRFRGEQGFTRVAVAQAKGYMFRSFKEVCKRSEDNESQEPPGYSLVAFEKSHRRAIGFSAFRSTEEPFEGDTIHSAVAYEKRRGMRLIRVVSVLAPPGTFVVTGPSSKPDSATVSPPAPFTGTASFRWLLGTPTEWQGTLAVDLPGLGEVSLAGPSFESELCLAQRCVGQYYGLTTPDAK